VTEILPRVKKIHKAFRLPLTGIVRYPGLAQYDVFFHQSRYLTASYRPENYDGPAVLYRPEDTPNADRAVWARHLAPDAAFVTLPGSHNTMLSEPNVALLAADLRARLAAT
jgi:thioesterase domain-containing protein